MDDALFVATIVSGFFVGQIVHSVRMHSDGLLSIKVRKNV